MHVIEITLAGRIPTGALVPATFARLHRIPASEQIKVSLISLASERVHFVEADCAEDVVSMAECLADHLGGTVEEYMKTLNLLVKYSGNS